MINRTNYIALLAALFSVCFLNVFEFQAQNTAKKEQFTYTVTGVVKDAETKMPVAGIRISYRELTAAMTDEQGHFSIQVPAGDVQLGVSGPGYAPKVVFVKGRTEIQVELFTEGFKTVFEPVFVPEGTASPLSGTHAWASLNRDNTLSTDVTADELFQGQFSGVNLIHHSGSPAAGSNLYIRGLNTLNAGTQPLFIVDGIPYENSLYSTSLLGNYYSNPLASLDPKDIENITVLKDGTSQYGTKGANGVILIRTLKVGAMETKINAHVHTGINFEPRQLPLLNAGDHKLLLSDVLQSQGMSGSKIQSLPYMDESLPVAQNWGYEGNPDYYRYNNRTNWQDVLYDPGFNQNYYMSVFGGDEVAIYGLSIGYLNQEGVVNNTSFDRFNTRFNAEVNLNKKFKLGANMNFLFSKRELIDEGPSETRNPIFAALIKAPFMTMNARNESGASSPLLEDYDVFGNSNPYSLINNSMGETSQFRFIGNINASYIANEHLDFEAMMGVNFNKESEKLFFPNVGVYYDTLNVGAVGNLSQHRVDRILALNGAGSANYKTRIGLYHSIKGRLGIRFQTNKAEDDWAKAANTGSDNFISIGYGDPLFSRVGGQISNWNWVNLYASADYAYKEKYFLNYTMAYDGSSRFGDDASDFIAYPSVSGAWLISAESFLGNSDFLDLLKLRAGWGLSGNDEIGNYSGVQYYVPQNILGNYGVVRGNLVDLGLKPEQSAKMNLGLDAVFFNERLNLSVDLYRNTISEMIVRMPVNREYGFPYAITNGGEMRNTGFDLSIASRIINNTFKWDLGVVISAYKNEVTDLGGKEYITSVCGADILTRVGEPAGVFYGYKTNGIYATQQEAEAEGLMVQQGGRQLPFAAGDVRFVNTDDSNSLIDENDREIIGDPNPDLFGAITSAFKYKNWELNVMFTYSLGNDIYNYTRSQLENVSSYNNQSKAVRNRWKTEGDRTDIPRATYGDPMGNARFSDRWIEDGSYIRMKSLSLSYRLPLRLAQLRACTFFATAGNLLTFTKYKGSDPEFALGRSPLYNGIDATFVPMPKTVSLGFKLEL